MNRSARTDSLLDPGGTRLATVPLTLTTFHSHLSYTSHTPLTRGVYSTLTLTRWNAGACDECLCEDCVYHGQGHNCCRVDANATNVPNNVDDIGFLREVG